VAAKAGVTPGLVQYYFPTLDHVFIATIRRRSEQNLARLTDVLRTRAAQPLHALWEYSRDEATAALTTEFLALGNHRKSIRAEIAEVTERVRRVQLDALQERLGTALLGDTVLSPAALLWLVTGVPKLVRLEDSVGVTTGHAEVADAFARYLARVEPRTPTARQAQSRERQTKSRQRG